MSDRDEKKMETGGIAVTSIDAEKAYHDGHQSHDPLALNGVSPPTTLLGPWTY
jgi:hypothetical protein